MKTIVRNMRTLAASSSMVIIAAISVSALALVISSEYDILVDSDIVSAEDITLEAGLNLTIAPDVSVESTAGDTKLLAGRSIELRNNSSVVAHRSMTLTAGVNIALYSDATIATPTGSVTVNVVNEFAMGDLAQIASATNVTIRAVAGPFEMNGESSISAGQRVFIESGANFYLDNASTISAQENISITFGLLSFGHTATIAGGVDAPLLNVIGSSDADVFNIFADDNTVINVSGGGGATLNYGGEGVVTFTTPNSGTIRSTTGSADVNFAGIGTVRGEFPDSDGDSDGIPNAVDNCPSTPNPDQSDLDGQNGGDVCDVCPNDPTDACDPGRSAAGSVDPDGGVLSTSDGSVIITIPPGAVDDDTSLSITDSGNGALYELTTNLGQGTALFGVAIEPDGQVFDAPVTITFSWSDADNDGKIDDTSIREDNVIVTKDNVAITDRCKNEPGPLAATGAECDTAANTFSFQITSLSDFALFSQRSGWIRYFILGILAVMLVAVVAYLVMRRKRPRL